MPIKHIAVACQGGGSHAAYAAGALPVLLPQFHNARLAADPGPAGAGAEEVLQLAGISGTSGGAISALLAWYGFLLGGPEAARSRLENFWHANCANAPGEKLFNDALQWMGSVAQVDLKLSPYLSPLRDIETAATATWPMLASMWPPLGSWIRGHYFQLRESVAPHVDFDLVGALGDFCSIPLEVKRWQACELEARITADAPARERLRARQDDIAQDVRARLAVAPWIVDWTRRHDIAPDALLRAVFDAWRAPELVFEAATLERLADAVRQATDAIPQLLIGAVDIDSGAFVAFSSERAALDAGITLDAVVASASLPWVFMAQTIQGTDPETHEKRRMSCWDGLFSQNPPIKNFISGTAGRARKPDGIWILQINQDTYDFSNRVGKAGAQSGDELWHRRDTLSGNLSLNQEVAFIEAVNARLDDPAQRAGRRDKPIEVVRIVMDGEAVGASARRDMGLFSKSDRDPGLAKSLLAHGREQARRYLALRAQSGQLWETLAQGIGAMGAQPSARLAQALPYLAGRERLAGGLVAPDVITVGSAGQATLRWHASEAVLDGRTLRIKGSTLLKMDDGAWRLDATRLLDVEQRGASGAPAGPPLPTRAGAPWPVAGEQRPDGGAGETLH
ncbi:patatin-like phospholipase family protein [Massilia sp. YIM B02443]|uniref:patatin-like phospholipase family protein n=1 Tax=Massilia sp. YIM B02443 TaxID=3050127 RepID=UPI0025B676A5|nr:patatin-like phospholipase family protein [Massilia sp. YIM B02443]MDN4039988.1 patatin-like phospholipase family protein [Massilia sp. YIM B02443]